jgi:hypothetical protein
LLQRSIAKAIAIVLHGTTQLNDALMYVGIVGANLSSSVFAVVLTSRQVVADGNWGQRQGACIGVVIQAPPTSPHACGAEAPGPRRQLDGPCPAVF